MRVCEFGHELVPHGRTAFLEELRPDASGEGLRASELFRIFREELRKFYSDFSVVLF